MVSFISLSLSDSGNVGPMIEVPDSHKTPRQRLTSELTGKHLQAWMSLRDACAVPDSLFAHSDAGDL